MMRSPSKVKPALRYHLDRLLVVLIQPSKRRWRESWNLRAPNLKLHEERFDPRIDSWA